MKASAPEPALGWLDPVSQPVRSHAGIPHILSRGDGLGAVQQFPYPASKQLSMGTEGSGFQAGLSKLPNPNQSNRVFGV